MRDRLSQSGSPLTISVVIPTFRRARLLAAVVAPFISDPAGPEVILMDDGSDDETPRVCRALAEANPQVRAYRQPNLGPAAARAAGLDAATTDIVLFVDDDVVADEGLASGHLRHHQASDRPLVVIGYMPPVYPRHRRPGQFPVCLYGADYELVCTGYEQRPEAILQHLWSGNMSVRREYCRKAGEALPSVPYHEDQVLGRRLADLGCSAVFDRSLSSRHLYERKPGQFFQDCRRDVTALRVLEGQGLAAMGEELDARVPPWQRRLSRALASWYGLPARTVMALVLKGAGRLHLWAAETWSARALRQVVVAQERYRR